MTIFSTSAILEGHNLSCQRGGHDIFGTLSFRATPGQLTQIRGPNGAGKSTLLKLIAGLLPRASGQITFNSDDDQPVGEHCHYLSHQPILKPTLTVEENLTFWQTLYGNNVTTIDDALEQVGLAHLKYSSAETLSAGQHQRINIARLLLSDRHIWLLDEPTSALDDHAITQLGKIMATHLDCNGLIIAATHQPLPTTKNTIIQTLDIARAGIDRTGAA